MDGKISIAHVHGAVSGDFINITVEDGTSGVQFLDLDLSLEALALALTGQGHQPCTFALRGIEHVGKRLETKEERIPYRATYDAHGKADSAAKLAALSPYHVDGWRGRESDLGNFHRGNPTDGYLVHFSRFTTAIASEPPSSSSPLTEDTPPQGRAC